jgi:hypothetical protein
MNVYCRRLRPSAGGRRAATAGPLKRTAIRSVRLFNPALRGLDTQPPSVLISIRISVVSEVGGFGIVRHIAAKIVGIVGILDRTPLAASRLAETTIRKPTDDHEVPWFKRDRRGRDSHTRAVAIQGGSVRGTGGLDVACGFSGRSLRRAGGRGDRGRSPVTVSAPARAFAAGVTRWAGRAPPCRRAGDRSRSLR